MESRGVAGIVADRMEPSDELAIIERYMREKGMRWTTQRHTIARVAMSTHSHFTAEELLEMCRKEDRGISRATVYRTLGMLEDANFIEGLNTGDGSRRFEHVLGHEHHEHMVCRKCGEILEFVDERLEAMKRAIAVQHGFLMTNHSLRIFGICKACQVKGVKPEDLDRL